MNYLLFLSVFSMLGIFYCILGLLASKKVKTTADYFLAGRNLGLLPVTLTLIATQLGGGMLLGTSEKAYSFGLYGLLYTLGMSIGFLMLGCGFAAKLQSLTVATTAELFDTRYGSPALKKVASLLSVMTMCGILISQVVGSRSIIEGLNLNNELLFIGFWLFVILYTMVGGLKAVVITDIFQVLFIIVIFAGIFIYSLVTNPTSWFSLPSIINVQKDFFSASPLSTNALIATVSMPALFSLIEQDLAQRFFAARTKRIAAFSALFSGIFMITFALVPIYFGMEAQLQGLAIPTGKSPLIAIIGLLTNELILVLAVCAIIAAITSTADSLLCAISSNIAQDFDFGWLGTHNPLRRSQVITLIIGIIALGTSYIVPQNIIDILINSYELSVSCLLVPLLFAYFAKDVKKSAAIGAIVCGLAGFIGIAFWQTDLPKALLPVILSLIGYIIGSLKK